MQERNGRPPETAALLAFPTALPVKILGRRERSFAMAVTRIVLRHAPDFLPETLEMRSSRQGKYLSLTATVNATSREQLDALYQELCDHPDVVMVL